MSRIGWATSIWSWASATDELGGAFVSRPGARRGCGGPILDVVNELTRISVISDPLAVGEDALSREEQVGHRGGERLPSRDGLVAGEVEKVLAIPFFATVFKYLRAISNSLN